MDSLRVSVIIPYYKARKTIEATLNSVYALDWPNLEVVLVNDGSPDQSDDFLKSLQDQSPIPFVLLNETKNRKLPNARNLGLKHATGDFIIFLDADDRLLPQKIRLQLPFLIENKLDVVISDMLVFKPSEAPKEQRIRAKQPDDDWTLFVMRTAIQISMALFRKTALDRVTGFRMVPAEEKDLFFRMVLIGATFDYIQGPVCEYFIVENSRTSNEIRYLKEGIHRNHWLLVYNRLKKQNDFPLKYRQLIARKLMSEARTWARYGFWKYAFLRFRQAKKVFPDAQPQGSSAYKKGVKYLGFLPVEMGRFLLSKFKSRT